MVEEQGKEEMIDATKTETKVKESKSVKKSATAKSKVEKADGGMGTKAKELSPKTMGNTDQNGCRKNVSDVVMFGDDLFKLLSKASSENEGWMKSTKAFDTGAGCVVQVTTQQRNPDGSYSVAEALAFVPATKIRENKNASGEVIARSLMGKR